MPHRILKAREQMCSALDLLDSSDAAADIGAQLDLAIHRLDEELKTTTHQLAPGGHVEKLKPSSPTHKWRRGRRSVGYGAFRLN